MATFGSILSSSNQTPAEVQEVVTPTTAQSITISAGTTAYLVKPAGTLALLTITMPASPTDGQKVWISSSQIITGLTLSANTAQSILNVPTTLVLGGFCGFIWNTANTTWFRIS